MKLKFGKRGKIKLRTGTAYNAKRQIWEKNVRDIKDHPTGYEVWLIEFQKEKSEKIEGCYKI